DRADLDNGDDRAPAAPAAAGGGAGRRGAGRLARRHVRCLSPADRIPVHVRRAVGGASRRRYGALPRAHWPQSKPHHRRPARLLRHERAVLHARRSQRARAGNDSRGAGRGQRRWLRPGGPGGGRCRARSRRGHASHLDKALRPRPGLLYLARPRGPGLRHSRGAHDAAPWPALGGRGQGRRARVSPGQPATHHATMAPFSLFSLQGKVAVVTGGSRGLGKEIATALAAAGARVAISARREQWLTDARRALEAAGFDCLAATCDVADEHQASAFVEQVLARFGRIDILVNNAGISWGAPSLEMPLERWRSVLEVNATGAFIMCRLVGRHMIERRRAAAHPGGTGGVAGKIINIGSVMGLQGTPPEVLAAAGYSASKG